MTEPRPPLPDVSAPSPADLPVAPSPPPSIVDVLGGTGPLASAVPARRKLTLRNYLWIFGAALVLLIGLHYLGPVLTPFLILSLIHISEPTRRTPISYAV